MRFLCYLLPLLASKTFSFHLPITTNRLPTQRLLATDPQALRFSRDEIETSLLSSRRGALSILSILVVTMQVPIASFAASTKPCTDIESCRELGEKKMEQNDRENPITILPNGIRYKIIRPPVGSPDEAVREGSVVDLAFSINANGGYLYSQGMGLEKVSGRNDLGLDSIRVVIGRQDVPKGIEQVLVGMRRGERRRIMLPPEVGFETSDWKPRPNNPVAQQRQDAYRRLLEGSPNNPPFPAASIWDVEVLKVRS